MSTDVLSPLFAPRFRGRCYAVSADVERDARLVNAALENDGDYRFIVERYHGRVYATALRMLGNVAEAEDVAQEAFIKAHRALARFDTARPFGPWVCTIAANLARDHLRRPFRRLARVGLRPFRDDEPSTEAGQQLEHDALSEELAEALLKIPEKLRHAIVLRFVSDMSVQEVADALGLKPSATKMRIKRGLDLLREIVDAR